MTRVGWIAFLALLLGCAQTSVVQHQAVPQAHTPEYISISSIDVEYVESLNARERSLATRYRPGERVAEKIRDWAEETGMWGGAQSLVIRVISVGFKWRFDHTLRFETPLENLIDTDRLGTEIELRQANRLLHSAHVERSVPEGTQAASPFADYSGPSMDHLAADVAWQIVYELTPPGYDETIIRAGVRDRVQAAWHVAARRGLITRDEWSIFMMRGADNKDVRCGYLLSKSPELPLWLWKAWTWGPFHMSYEECQERAAQAARRR